MQQTEPQQALPFEDATTATPVDIPSVSSSTLQNVAEHPRTPDDVLSVWVNGEELNAALQTEQDSNVLGIDLNELNAD